MNSFMCTQQGAALCAMLSMQSSLRQGGMQRGWITLQEKKIPYQWKEVNPYKKDKEYLAINPKGLVPALTHHGAVCLDNSLG